MNTIIIILIVAAMIATVVMLVRGIAAFLMSSTAEVHGEGGAAGPSAASLKSNKMMQARIFFQAIAVMLVVALFVLAGKS